MGEFLERLTSGRTILLIAVAVVLALRLSASSDRARDSTNLALPAAHELGVVNTAAPAQP